MKPIDPQPVNLVIGILYSDTELLERGFELLQEKYGPFDHVGKAWPFDSTDYYLPEMGEPIHRLFCSHRDLVNPGKLAQIKIECNHIEDQLAVNGKRKINLDPGYLDYDKFVLASAKYSGHKIYLDLGIYADTTLRYQKGHYVPCEYSFPDFKSRRYEDEFLTLRTLYKNKLK